jgi:hypothetical protein
MNGESLWIGLDVGGSGARAQRVESAGDGWTAQDASLELLWSDGFRPVSLREQLAYPGELLAEEEVYGSQRIRLLAELVASAAAGASFQLGVSAPGLQTSDGRGIQAWRNGPRRPTFQRDLELSLKGMGAKLLAPLASICPDSLACALGESRGAEGALGERANALCISGGSGIGEAALVMGACVALDALDPPLPRAWELSGGEGCSLEDRVAPGRVLSSWVDAGEVGSPEESGRESAARLLEAQDSALLVLMNRAREWFLSRELELECVVLAQALGRLYSQAPSRLSSLRSRCEGVEIIASDFRAAPAVGAVIYAAEQER